MPNNLAIKIPIFALNVYLAHSFLETVKVIKLSIGSLSSFIVARLPLKALFLGHLTSIGFKMI